MQFSLIKNGIVENIIIADNDFIVQYAKDHGYSYVDFDQNPNALIGAKTTDNINFDTSMYKTANNVVDTSIVEPKQTTGMQSV
jgi:hypothetical protein